MDVSECCSLRRMGRPSRRLDEAICQCGDAENNGPAGWQAGTCSIGLAGDATGCCRRHRTARVI